MSIGPVALNTACAPTSPHSRKSGGPCLASSLIQQTLEQLGTPPAYGPGGRATPGGASAGSSLSFRV